MTANLEGRIRASENKCCRIMLRVSCIKHKNKRMCRPMATGRYPRRTLGALMSTARLRKLSWFGHVCRHDTLPKIILQGTVDGCRRGGRPRKSWDYNINEFAGQSMSSLLRIQDDGGRWVVIASGCICRSTPNNAWASQVLDSQLLHYSIELN